MFLSKKQITIIRLLAPSGLGLLILRFHFWNLLMMRILKLSLILIFDEEITEIFKVNDST